MESLGQETDRSTVIICDQALAFTRTMSRACVHAQKTQPSRQFRRESIPALLRR